MPIQYSFHENTHCNMCRSDVDRHKKLGKRMNTSQGLNPKKLNGITVDVMRCTTCGLVFTQQMPIPKSIQDHYGVEPEKYWQSDYFVTDEKEFKAKISTFKRLAQSSTKRALDIGAGIGQHMRIMQQEGFETFGLEPSETFYERALSANKIDPSKLQCKSIAEAEYEQSSFDFISFRSVLEHVYDPSGALEKCLNWLTDQGLIHVEVPSSQWLITRLANTWYRFTGTTFVGNLSPMHPPYHLYEFDLESFRKNGDMLGYDIAYLEYYVCDTYLPRIFDPILKPYMKWSRKGMQLCVWLRKTG